VLLLRRRPIIVIILIVGLLAAAWLLRAFSTHPVDSFQACADAGYPVRESDPPTCSDGTHTFIGPRATPAGSPEPVTAIDYQLLVDGDSLGDYERIQEHFSNQADWQAYWRRIHAAAGTLPPIIDVDFKTSDVVALSLGRKPTGGYNVRVSGIASSAAGTSVSITETSPGAKCIVTDALTNPYYIVRTPKLTEPVSFKITTEKHEC
jgi:hypothetical protein